MNLFHPSIFALALLCVASQQGFAEGRFTTGQNTFMLDGQHFTVKAAELHYPRIPRPYWQNRIQMCKALGMNTICLYVFWNIHEQEPGKFDFNGGKDLREFIRLCQQEGMYVILRPGPYVCAEWEMGGLPWWLLSDKEISLRDSDPRFLSRVDAFEDAVAEQVADLTIDNGGPIIMVQVENEYGSYGKNPEYVAAIRDMLRKHYGETLLFQCDWESNYRDNALPDLLWTMNFGTGADIDAQFAKLREDRPESPLMCSEYWSGWFDKWGAHHETRSADAMIQGIGEMLDKNISFSLYMTHGGTNRGHWAGANSPGYEPDVTSYDYDAPINEQGSPTPKYFMLRELMSRHSDSPLPPMPDTVPVMSVPEFSLTEYAPLWDSFSEAVSDTTTRNMEAYGQGYGSILYSSTLPELPADSKLVIRHVHDYGQVFINKRLAGVLDRRNGDTELRLPPTVAGDTLDILVEAMGRINFGRSIKDFKGINGVVGIESPEGCYSPGDWSVRLLPDDYNWYAARKFVPIPETDSRRLPRGLYRGTFFLDSIADTYLDFTDWGKGLVYVNGHDLGRIWSIGPQQTIYTPGCWLKPGENEILILDIIGPEATTVTGRNYPVNDLVRPGEQKLREQEEFDRSNLTYVSTERFDSGPGWKEVRLPHSAKGRLFAIEIVSTANPDDLIPAMAELQLLDADGNPISREAWRKVYADSEDTATGNHTVEKLFDNQESTYWSIEAGSRLPCLIVIALGEGQEIGGIRYVPRMEAGAPGAIGEFNIYVGSF